MVFMPNKLQLQDYKLLVDLLSLLKNILNLKLNLIFFSYKEIKDCYKDGIYIPNGGKSMDNCNEWYYLIYLKIFIKSFYLKKLVIVQMVN